MVTDNYCFPHTLHSEERGRINETNYHYSIMSPPILVAKSNRQKRGGGGVMLSKYGNLMVCVMHMSPTLNLMEIEYFECSDAME